MKERLKRQLLWALKKITTQNGNSLMIVDGWCLRVLSSCCSISDVLEIGITAIEFLEAERKSIKTMNSLYFLSDIPNSITLFTKDFKKRKEKYKSAYLLFNSHFKGSSHLEYIAKNVSLKKITGCTEILLDFIAYESRVFLTGKFPSIAPSHSLKDTFINQKSKSFTGVPDTWKNYDGFETAISTITGIKPDYKGTFYESIFSVLGIRPTIRYQQCDHLLSEDVARSAQAYIEKDQVEAVADRDSDIDSVFLVLCRCNDLNPLFLHEFTYQSFIYDKLDINVTCGPSDKNTSKPNDILKLDIKGNKAPIYLSEADELWLKYRHQHLQKVNQSVLEEVNSFSKQKNKAFTSTDTALDLVRSIPQLQQKVDRYSSHVSISETCFKQIEKENLMIISQIEQDLATGFDKSGKSANFEKLLASTSSIVTNPDIPEVLRCRLLLLYVINTSRLSSSDVKALITGSSFSPEIAIKLNNFLFKSNLLWSPPKPLDSVVGGSAKCAHKISKYSESDDYYKKNRNNEYELSRFKPNLYFILKKLIQQTLSFENYPLVSNGQGNRIKTLVVYICGGFTFSESRICYLLSKELNVDIYLGGDAILLTKNMLNN